MRYRWIVWIAALVAGIGAGVGIAAARQSSPQSPSAFQTVPQLTNPRLDPGNPYNFVAPGFTLTDQFGKTVSLSSFRGKAVVLSFNDPLCTTICPLTTSALVEAKELLGPAAANVQLLGVGANPDATEVKWVRAYSQAHRMMRKWRFLTGSLPQLKHVWDAYGILAQVEGDEIDHTPATFIVDPNGRITRLFMTRMSYSSVPQLAQVLARAIAADLPGNPPVRDSVSLATIPLIGPRKHVRLPLARGESLLLGPGNGPRLVLFFDTGEEHVSSLTLHLLDLNQYAALSSVAPLVAVDEASVEPSAHALRDYLTSIPALAFPVAIDTSGRLADGYRVENSPWLTLVSGSGRILWQYDVGGKGWPSVTSLVGHVHAALAGAK
ncbi:MAG: hypothetical protein QOG85_440 [Gaiellaceae bacterium]|jgi:cytochrome oxidase Cu insertion factor (SCO1/SenC/PrrC family)|nr:hypothetical protein [Gaiellaceae bacterium]